MCLLGMIGVPEIIIILLIVLLLFGGKKIPEMMRGLGKGVKEYKDAVNGLEKDFNADSSKNKAVDSASESPKNETNQ